ncbi:Serine/Threonine kinase domain protein (macronuclear) [Tetrahymena thermophila SB210]|uniref:Serine/Threonine kinase domain protein n=1 Tax=Tetrahymena thermophila (strain SB210) TaxID=312017 RepID=I7M087_TETTS|nr:Serine/Threonine kinase domain protein [Tetrahymena thermophila SB210]EAR85679.2 Serine/Threonine kinase domain protein [Tetrahymena thermophila SB210]|eukprot:XP_001033342.2 Serine/Threonine kinase domain protein [Tetrahymena thermophila SB210]
MENQESQQEQLFLNRYRLGRNIGQGSQGQVKLALDTQTGLKVAIKIFKHRKMNNMDFLYLQREVNILSQLQGHRAFLKLIDFAYNIIYVNGHGQKEVISVIIMEYANNGCLFDLVSFFQEKYSENVIKVIALQLIDAIEHMQKYKISHRDLKLENIVIDANYNLKIIDFGLSIQETQDCKPKSNVGTTPYAPPERFLGKEYSGQKFDIFSLGVLLFVLRFNQYPFTHSNPENSQESGSFFLFSENRQQFWELIISNERPEELSFLDMLNWMLQQDPQNRPSIEELRLHPFLFNNNSCDNKIEKFLQMRKEIMNEMMKKQKVQKNEIQLQQQQKEKHQRCTEQNQKSNEQNQSNQSISNESSVANQQPLISQIIEKHKNQQFPLQFYSKQCQMQISDQKQESLQQKIISNKINPIKLDKQHNPLAYQQKMVGQLIQQPQVSFLLKTSIFDMKHLQLLKQQKTQKNISDLTKQHFKKHFNKQNSLNQGIKQQNRNKIILTNSLINKQQLLIIHNEKYLSFKKLFLRQYTYELSKLLGIEKQHTNQNKEISKQINQMIQFHFLTKIQQYLIIFLFQLNKLYIKFNQILSVLIIQTIQTINNKNTEQRFTHQNNQFEILF